MRFPIWIPLVVAALLALLGSVFTVSEGEAAIVLNLGRVVRTDIGPGLHFKWPLVESARVFDRRLTVSTPTRSATSPPRSKDVSVDFFAIGRIEDLRAFYRATSGDEQTADAAPGADHHATRCATRSTRARCRRWCRAIARRSSTSQLAGHQQRRRDARRAHRRPAHQADRPAHRQRSHRQRLQPHARPAPAGGQPPARRGRGAGAPDPRQCRPRPGR